MVDKSPCCSSFQWTILEGNLFRSGPVLGDLNTTAHSSRWDTLPRLALFTPLLLLPAVTSQINKLRP